MNTATMTDSTRDVNAQSVSDSPTGHGGVATAGDPFATQRTADNDPFAEQQQQRQRQESVSVEDGDSPTQGDYPTGIRDRRMSKEWGMFGSCQQHILFHARPSSLIESSRCPLFTTVAFGASRTSAIFC